MRILYADDDPFLREQLVEDLREAGPGWQVATAQDGQEALERLRESPFDILLTDLRMPRLSGLELARRVHDERPDLDVILLTGEGGMRDVIEAVRAGVADFIEKPLTIDYLTARLRVLAERRELRAENRHLRRRLGDQLRPKDVVGVSEAMKAVYDVVDRVRDGASTVLLLGESGTGKEVIAQAIHYGGNRRDEPFVPVDCGAMSETLIERELFGHVKGAFTGATSDQPGLLTAAGAGTIFLDEIGELPAALQVKLLRTLQQREVRPVGSTRTHALEARIMAATNRDLREEVAEKRFREDLYYRLAVVTIELPPLRARRGDIPLLAADAIRRLAPREGGRVTGIEPEALAALERHEWPGNVRELHNCIEQAIALCRGERIGIEDLPPAVRGHPAGRDAAAAGRTLADYERRAIRDALAEAGGNKRLAAQILEISPTTLYAKIKTYGLS